MMSKLVKSYGWAVMVLVGMFVSGCVPKGPVHDPVNIPSAGMADVFSTGDLVIVSFSGTGVGGLEDHEERVKADGTISLAQVGSIKALGKTANELQSELQQKYSALFRNLNVTVSEIRYFYVDGEVVAPSRYRHDGNMTVTRAITVAGGFTNFANKRKVLVTRAGGGKPIEVNCAKALEDPTYDIPVYPNDQIRVKRRFMW